MTKNPPDVTVAQFSTERLQLASFLHADARLRFVGCEPSPTGKVRFLFEDLERIGDELELEYERGAPIAATALFASQKFLRRQMDGTFNGNRRPGDARHAYRREPA